HRHNLHQTTQSSSVQLHQGLRQIQSVGPRFRVGLRLDPGDQSFNSLAQSLECLLFTLHLCGPVLFRGSAPYPENWPNIGEWRVSSVLPSPRYMCTPHGRHGSKLRTARIISMPLKLSGPFSSKIGVPCTASSYGPGVP